MIRHKILDIFVTEDDTISQKILECFKNSIKQDYDFVDIVLDIETKEVDQTRHNIALKYDTLRVPVETIDRIIKDFYPNYDKESNEIF